MHTVCSNVIARFNDQLRIGRDDPCWLHGLPQRLRVLYHLLGGQGRSLKTARGGGIVVGSRYCGTELPMNV